MEDCWCGNLIKHAKNLKLKSKGELYIHVQNDCFVFMCRIHWFWAAVCLEMVLWDCTNGPSCGCPLMCRCQHSKKLLNCPPSSTYVRNHCDHRDKERQYFPPPPFLKASVPYLHFTTPLILIIWLWFTSSLYSDVESAGSTSLLGQTQHTCTQN